MWIVFGIAYLALILFCVYKKSKLFYHPVFWMTMAAVLVIGMYYSSGYVYNHPLKMSGLLYYLGVVGCFATGFFVSQKWKKPTPKADYNNFYLKMNKSIYFWITLVGAVVFLVDFFVHNSLASSDLHTNAVNSTIGILGKICLLFGIVVWLGEVAAAIQSDQKISIVGYISAAMYFIPAVLTSGRQSFIIFIIATVAIVFYSLNVNRNYQYLKHYLLIGMAVVGMMLTFCLYVAITRQSVGNKAELFEKMFNCSIPDNTEKIFIGMGAFGMLFCEIVSYYSHELPMFQVFLDHWDGYPMLGASQFQLISRNINQDSIYSFSAMWDKLDALSEQANVYSHVWRTISANCIIDYGIVGGLIFMIILGMLSGRVYAKVMADHSMNNQIMLAMVNSGAFFSMQFSPLVEGYWYFPMMWLLFAIPIMNYVLKGVIKK